MADGITNPTYAGVGGLGIVNDLDGLETAIQDASASNKRLLVNKIEGNNGTAYFVSAESKTARAIRNIKAFFGQGETGRAHDAKVKDALVALANKKAADGSATSYQKLRARAIAQTVAKLNSNSISGNAALTFKAAIVSALRDEQSVSPDIDSHEYESLDEGHYDFSSSYPADDIEDDYSYPDSLTDRGSENQSRYGFSSSHRHDDIEGDYSYPDSVVGGNPEATATKPKVASTSSPTPEITLVSVTDRDTGLRRAATQAEKTNWQQSGGSATRPHSGSGLSGNASIQDDDYAYTRDTDTPTGNPIGNARHGGSAESLANGYEVPHGQYEPDKPDNVKFSPGFYTLRTRDFDDATQEAFINDHKGQFLEPFKRTQFKFPEPGTPLSEVNGAFRDAVNLAGVRTEDIHKLAALFRTESYEEIADAVVANPQNYYEVDALANNPGAQQIYAVARLLDGFISTHIDPATTSEPLVSSQREASNLNRETESDEVFTALDPSTREADDEVYTPVNYRVTE